MSIVVVIPSRGRPGRARGAVAALRETAVLISTSIVLAIDADDPVLSAYEGQQFAGYGPEVSIVRLAHHETGNLVRATNTVAMRIAEHDPSTIIGNLGDDHVARTPGWDLAIENALGTPGIAYGRDGIQDEDLPTAPFISAQIVLALGYYFLPDVDHMYVDNAVRDIAEQAGVRRYLPELLFEHMHPAASKAPWDAGYIRVNAEEPVRNDRLHYESWREHAMATDIGRVRDALQAVA